MRAQPRARRGFRDVWLGGDRSSMLGRGKKRGALARRSRQRAQGRYRDDWESLLRVKVRITF